MANDKGNLGKLAEPVKPAPPVPPLLSADQFLVLQKTLIYAAAIFGTLASGKQPSPTKVNLESLKAYADAVLEMVK